MIASVDLESAYRVGRYGVDVAAVDAIADALSAAPGVDVVLVDEIGRMECLSRRFVDRMRALLESRTPMIATVAQRGGGFIADVKGRPDVDVWPVTRTTRDELPRRVLGWLDARR